MATEQKGHFEKIDYLRGIAILMVFIYHCQGYMYGYAIKGYQTNGKIELSDTKSLLLNFSPSAFGWAGVNLFLIISGFLIHLGYLKNQTKFNVGTFYSKRLWRIYPPYLLVLLFIILSTNGIFYYFNKNGLPDFLAHVFLIHNFFDNTFLSINPAFWTLALETQLYLIYPIFLYIRKRIGINKASLVILLISIILLLIGISNKTLDNSISYQKSVIKLWFIWVAGAYLAEAHFSQKVILKKGGWLVAVLFLALTIAAKYFIYTNYLTDYLVTLGLFLFFDWVLQTKSINTNALISKIIISIGLCSYSIYLIHMPFMNQMLNFFNIILTKNHNFTLLKVIPVFIVIYLISHSLYLLIELPSVKLGEKFRSRKINK